MRPFIHEDRRFNIFPSEVELRNPNVTFLEECEYLWARQAVIREEVSSQLTDFIEAYLINNVIQNLLAFDSEASYRFFTEPVLFSTSRLRVFVYPNRI